jgi:hypothetical protein
MEQERRRSTDGFEATIKKLKNSGYLVVAGLILNGGIWYQGNKDFAESQKVINARQQLTNEQQNALNNKYDTMIAELKAIVAGQDRRITMLENRQR